MTTEKVAQNKLKDFLASGDTQGATLFMQDLMREATRGESQFHNRKCYQIVIPTSDLNSS